MAQVAPISNEAFARKVGAKVGFDFLTILALIQALLPLIQSLPCFKKAAKKQKMADVMTEVEANIAESFRQCRKKKSDRLPARVAAAMASEGYTSKAERHRLWDAMNEVAFDEAKATAAALAA